MPDQADIKPRFENPRAETPPEVLPAGTMREWEHLEQIASRLDSLEKAVDRMALDEEMPGLLHGLARAWSAVLGGIAIPLHHEIGRRKAELLDRYSTAERERRG